MDAFFAAVEERDKPWLSGMPIAIGSDPEEGKGRGVVSTANYKARAYGIHSALPISTAWKLSQEAVKRGEPGVAFITPNMHKYMEVSSRIMAIVRTYAEHIEEASIDEAYFDLSRLGNFAKAVTVAKKIQKEIQEKELLTASIGIGPNKLVAKIASDFKKPHGLTIVKPSEVKSFIAQIGLRKIPGIGPKMELALQEQGITTTKQLQALEPIDLELLLGKSGIDLYAKVRGIDDAPLVEEWVAQSIGEQETLQHDTLAADILLELFKKLCAQVFNRFAKSEFTTFKTVGITVRFEGFEFATRSKTLSEPTGDSAVFEFETLKLLLPFLDARENPKRKPIRLLGVKIEKFT